MDVRSVQDSGTMPLISEIVLAVSVGCVEIRTSATDQEADEMDSYQVCVFFPSCHVTVYWSRGYKVTCLLNRNETWSVCADSGSLLSPRDRNTWTSTCRP